MTSKQVKPLLEFNDRQIAGQLAAYPSSIELNNIEIGRTYEFTVTAQNLAKEPRLIKATSTNERNFIVKNASNLEILAPYGLDKKIVVEFTPKEEREYSDTLIIKCDKDIIEVPMSAHLPSAQLVFDPEVIDFGLVVYNQSSVKSVNLRNIGLKVFPFVISGANLL
jgi:hypothetical protein